MNQKKLLFFVTEDWYFCSHRLPLAVAAKEAGYKVLVVTRVQDNGEQILREGFELIPIDLQRSSLNPFREIQTIWFLFRVYQDEQPSIVHHVALKPVIYGTLAASLARVPHIVNAMAGLGSLFSSKSYKINFVRQIVMLVFRFLLDRSGSCMILQNPDDVKLLLDSGVLKPDRVSLIRGSGVDIQKFVVYPEVAGIPLVVLASRMLWDKGVNEFTTAARILKKRGVVARFALVGSGDAENPRSISQKQLDSWREEGSVEVWGQRKDMLEVFKQSHIVCLPSYREGVPKVLLEAAACGRTIVTTDAPGCREVVRNDWNGLLVPVADAEAVASALEKLIKDTDLRKTMGKRGRELIVREFSCKKVNTEILKLYEEVIIKVD